MDWPFRAIFVTFVALLAAGWLVNVLTNPAYVMDLGTGSLKWVSAGCAVTAILNAALGYLGGRYWGGTAVVAASAFSLAVGYVIVLAAYHSQTGVPLLNSSRKQVLRSYSRASLAPRSSFHFFPCPLGACEFRFRDGLHAHRALGNHRDSYVDASAAQAFVSLGVFEDARMTRTVTR